MISIEVVTNIAPHYREELWLLLLRSKNFRFSFSFGAENKPSVRQIDFKKDPWPTYQGRVREVKNVRLGSVLVWQSGVLANAIRTESECSIILGDMYVVTYWLTAFILRLRRKKVIFWGHGLYGNERGIKGWVRRYFLSMADRVLVYGPHAKRCLVGKGFAKEKVSVVYNSFDYFPLKERRESSIDDNFYRSKHWFSENSRPVLIFVGRLTRQKKLEKLILAVKELNSEFGRVNLMIVGDGPERRRLEAVAEVCPGAIRFYGACYDQAQLSKLIANSILCVSPGEIGLTAIHSLSCGTPVCTHGDLPRQMPEVEAITNGSTGIFFSLEEDNLSKCIALWLDTRPDRRSVRAACYEVIDQFYNPIAQSDVIHKAVADVTCRHHEVKS